MPFDPSENTLASFCAAFPEIGEPDAKVAHDNLKRYARLAVVLQERLSKVVLTELESGGTVTTGWVEPRPLKNIG